MKSRAAVAFAGQPLQVVEIDVAPPRKGEVLVRISHTGVCHTDAFTLSGDDPPKASSRPCWAMKAGRGGGGGRRRDLALKPGDHVIPLYTAECGEVPVCQSGKTNLVCRCAPRRAGRDARWHKRAFRIKASPFITTWGCSTFSEYTVVAEVSLAKINPEANPRACVLVGCGVTTGLVR